jgi:hypothetical protein
VWSIGIRHKSGAGGQVRTEVLLDQKKHRRTSRKQVQTQPHSAIVPSLSSSPNPYPLYLNVLLAVLME